MNNDINQVPEQGFTLIEVMITVVIIGILAAIALPAYQNQITESRRTQAHICLTNSAQLEERYYIQNNTFVGGLASFGYATTSTAGTFVCPDSTSYLISAAEAAPTFTLTATRTGPQANDTVCGNFTLASTGAKGISGTGTVANCW